MTPALLVRGLGYRYGRGGWGVLDCDLVVGPGRVAELVGPNGAGQTTLLNVAAGLLAPTVGEVEVAGAAPGANLAGIGYVPQDAPPWPRLRVAEVLEIGRSLNPSFDEAMAGERIGRLGKRRGARIGHLSGGQRAPVALTLVLAKGPRLLLLDEPLSSLDPLARRGSGSRCW